MDNLTTFNGTLHAIKEATFAQTLTPVTLPEWKSHTQTKLTIPKIPYPLFRQVVAWQRKIAEEFRCETTTSLFLIDDEWKAVTFYQENTQGSMTADIDYVKDERNKDLLAEYADKSLVHATIHNHVFSGAGQSGRDADDEKGLPGPHITIGNLNRTNLSYHGRLSAYVGNEHKFLPLRFSDVIGIPLPPQFDVDLITKLELAYLDFTSEDSEIPKEWDDRFTKKVHQNTHNQNQNYSWQNKKKTDDENIEKLVENYQKLSCWPWDFLDAIDLSTQESFLETLESLPLIGVYAALSVATEISKGQPDYGELYALLCKRRDGSKQATQ